MQESTMLSLHAISSSSVKTIYDAPPSLLPEVVTYNKEAQTTATWTNHESDETEVMQLPKREDELRQRLRQEIEDELRQFYVLNVSTETVNGDSQKNFFVREFSEEERAAVSTSNEFIHFIERSSKVVERALDTEYDILADYGLGVSVEDVDQTERRLKEVVQFYDERWSKKRMVSDVNFSPKVKLLPVLFELCQLAYTPNSFQNLF
jgi:dynein intermediate chain